MKKITFLTIFILINIAVLYFAYINYPNIVTYKCIFNQKVYNLSLGIIAMIFTVAGNMAGFLYSIVLQENIVKMCSAYQKKNENISVKSEEDSARIKTLEAKIATLETALQAALKKD